MALLLGPPELCNSACNSVPPEICNSACNSVPPEIVKSACNSLPQSNSSTCNSVPQSNSIACNSVPQSNNTTIRDKFLDRLTKLLQAKFNIRALRRFLQAILQTGVLAKFLRPKLDVSLPPMGRTENFSPTFLSSGDACLDFFFQVVPDTPPHRVIQLLEAAWNQKPLTALKLVCQLRGVREMGKSDRQGFYAAACWMHSHHPKTLAANVAVLAEFGYLKDLPEILLRLLQGSEKTEKRIADRAAHNEKIRLAKVYGPKFKKTKISAQRARITVCRSPPGYFGRKGAAAREAKRLGTLEPREDRIAADISKAKQSSERASLARRQKRLEDASKALKRYSEDLHYRALHDEIAQHFADLLLKDLKAIKSHIKNPSFTLAAKWCPSLDSSYDLSTLLCENIARRVFPREGYADVADDRHYAYRVRDRLRKEVLVPLRKALRLPEVYMSANLWGELPYKNVASMAMKNYKDLFKKHDADRFADFLSEVRVGKKKIAAGALLPHEIIQQALQSEDNVAELQWQRMVKDMTKDGKFSDSLAVCDVSCSMEGTPMDVCIALGLLVSDMSEEPWRGHIITFSKNPELHLVRGESLKEKYKFTKYMQWDNNTDFQKVFDLLLKMARKSNLPPEKMIQQLVVFSDMEFDQASLNPWETDYMVIKRKFRDAGYEVPLRIVFWNLRDSKSTPVLKEQEGVAMVSGNSKNLLKLFMKSNGLLNPMLALEQTIQGQLFDQLAVLD